ncbi:hypothetical protein K239x_43050 [Planctomycetes bacterium K23_9]|uniref:Uncharacterized protein n=1 Tax=Stieleria marina TaxID=1930275 RepID=A0A517NYV0_9BACT|nr:hypothetical protein K239x_43050 [Planctomycetes bacterium K23_9]
MQLELPAQPRQGRSEIESRIAPHLSLLGRMPAKRQRLGLQQVLGFDFQVLVDQWCSQFVWKRVDDQDAAMLQVF